jgi:hypothetical protein
MRFFSHLSNSVLAWVIVGCAVAQATESAKRDPFLQAAQWEEVVPAEEGLEEPSYQASDDLVVCGDGVDLAASIEPNARQRGRWTALVELTTLFPSFSTSAIATANEHPILGPRLSLGWESNHGFGIRGRAWGFDSPVDMEDSYGTSYQSFYYNYAQSVTDHQINFSGGKFDLDFYKRIEHQSGHISFGASITAAELKLTETFTVTETAYYNNYYYYGYTPTPYVASFHEEDVVRNRGAGLGLLAEGSHRFYETPIHAWSVFGRGRMAYLIGEWQVPSGSGLDKGDSNMAIGEAALGLEYRRKFSRADLFGQCSFEVQSWDVSQVGRINFAGVTTGVGLGW